MGPRRRRRSLTITRHPWLETLEPRALLSADPSGRPLPGGPSAPGASVFLALSATNATYASDVNLVAHVVTTGGADANGLTVDFVDQQAKGDVIVGSAVVMNSAAAFTWNAAAIGTHHLVAQLEPGQSLNVSVSAPQDLTVTAGSTLISLTESGAGLTAAITADFVPVTTGTVTFFEGRKVLKTIRLSENGTATLPPISHGGEHDIVAAYNGCTQFKPSTSHPFVVVVGGTLPPGQITPAIKIVNGHVDIAGGVNNPLFPALEKIVRPFLRRRSRFTSCQTITLPTGTLTLQF